LTKELVASHNLRWVLLQCEWNAEKQFYLILSFVYRENVCFINNLDSKYLSIVVFGILYQITVTAIKTPQKIIARIELLPNKSDYKINGIARKAKRCSSINRQDLQMMKKWRKLLL